MFHCFRSVIGVHKHPQHFHDFHEIILILDPVEQHSAEGFDCTHSVDSDSFENHRGDLVILPGLAPHICLTHHPKGMNCLVLYFDEGEIITASTGDDEAEKILRALLEHAKNGMYTLPLTPQGTEKCRTIMEELQQEEVKKHSGWRCAMKKLFLELILCVLRNWNGKQTLAPEITHIESRERMAGVLRFLETNYMLPLSVDDVMGLSCLSRSHFHAIFKKETGHTFKEYLNNVRIRKAKQLIYNDDMPLSQIALACGFASQSHFCHVFRQYTGRTPQQERKKVLPHIVLEK